jgi:ubiquitin-activating enzyme E1
VRCKAAPLNEIPLTEEALKAEPWSLQLFDVVILTETDYKTIVAVNNFCRKHGKKFINTDVYGVFGRVFNDFGDSFEILDKDGEELQDCMIKSISCDEKALVELLPNAKHKF